MSKPIYKRVLLKLSGEALMGDTDFGISPAVLDRMASEIDELVNMGVEVALVVGGGNLCRGKQLSKAGIGRVTGDHMGMLATIMNALAMRDALERIDLPARIMSAIPMMGIVDPYNRRKAIHHLREGTVIIFAAGTGNPFFTTDSAASLRAIEIDADVLLKATKVDGIYSADPMTHPDAKKYSQLSYDEIIQQGLEVMDLTAICMCRDHDILLRVFNMNKPSALKSVIMGGDEGTVVGEPK